MLQFLEKIKELMGVDAYLFLVTEVNMVWSSLVPTTTTPRKVKQVIRPLRLVIP